MKGEALGTKDVFWQGHHFEGRRENRSYVEALQNNNVVKDLKEVVNSTKTLFFNPNIDDTKQYRKAFTGMIKNPEVDIDLKKIFLEEGIFSIRVTSLGLSYACWKI